MTTEERAKKLVEDWYRSGGRDGQHITLGTIDRDDLAARIAKMVEEAVQQERNRFGVGSAKMPKEDR